PERDLRQPPSGMSARAENVVQRSGTSAAAQPPGALSAPLFNSLIERLRSVERCVVLDLGAARTETIGVLSQFRCRLDIVELADGVDDLNGDYTAKELRDRVEALLPTRRREPTDVVLCWDLLN